MVGWFEKKIAKLTPKMVNLARLIRVAISKTAMYASIQAIDITISWPPAVTISFKP